MKNTVIALILVCLMPSLTLANDNHGLKIGQEECPALWADLVKLSLWSNPEALSHLGFAPLYREEIDSLKFVSSKDLDPGAYGVRRRVVFHMKVMGDSVLPLEDATLNVITQGNYFCEDEEILDFESFALSWDI